MKAKIYLYEESIPKSPKALPWFMILATVMMVAGPNICLPALPYLVDFFQTQNYVLKLSLMMTPLTSAFSGFLFSKLFSKKHIKTGVIIALIIFIIGSFLCAITTTITLFFLGRILQSFSAGCMAVATISTLNHFFHGVSLTKHMAIYGILFPITFATSPALGSFLFNKFGFSSCFYFLMIQAIIITIVLQKIFINFSNKSHKKLKEIFIYLMSSKNFILLVLCHSLPIATLQYYMAQSSFLWIKTFNYTMTQFALVQIIPITIQFLGTMIYRILVKNIGIERCIQIGRKIGSVFCLASIATIVFLTLNKISFSPILFLIIISIFFSSAVFFIVPHISLAMEFGKEFGTATSAQISAITNIVTSTGFIIAALMRANPINIVLTMTVLMFLLIFLSQRKSI